MFEHRCVHVSVWVSPRSQGKGSRASIVFFLTVHSRVFDNGMNVLSDDNNNSSSRLWTNDSVMASSRVQAMLLAVAMFTLSFVTVFGNTVVIYALRTNRNLRTVSFVIDFSPPRSVW